MTPLSVNLESVITKSRVSGEGGGVLVFLRNLPRKLYPEQGRSNRLIGVGAQQTA